MLISLLMKMVTVVAVVVMTIMRIVKFPISGEGASSPGTEALPTAIDRDPPLSDLVSGRPQNKNLNFKPFILRQFQITF